eukprot:1881625-Prymnesium_polylepis.1
MTFYVGCRALSGSARLCQALSGSARLCQALAGSVSNCQALSATVRPGLKRLDAGQTIFGSTKDIAALRTVVDDGRPDRVLNRTRGHDVVCV